MTTEDFKDLCLCGETTKVQFKETFTSQKEIAKEMIAFANSKGGVILFGVEVYRILPKRKCWNTSETTPKEPESRLQMRLAT